MKRWFVLPAFAYAASCGSVCNRGYIADSGECIPVVEYDIVCTPWYTEVDCYSADQVSEVTMSDSDNRYSCLWRSAVYPHDGRLYADVYAIAYFATGDDGCYELQYVIAYFATGDDGCYELQSEAALCADS